MNDVVRTECLNRHQLSRKTAADWLYHPSNIFLLFLLTIIELGVENSIIGCDESNEVLLLHAAISRADIKYIVIPIKAVYLHHFVFTTKSLHSTLTIAPFYNIHPWPTSGFQWDSFQCFPAEAFQQMWATQLQPWLLCGCRCIYLRSKGAAAVGGYLKWALVPLTGGKD